MEGVKFQYEKLEKVSILGSFSFSRFFFPFKSCKKKPKQRDNIPFLPHSFGLDENLWVSE